MLFVSSSSPECDISVDNRSVQCVSEFKYLGFIIDHDLKFLSHIRSLCGILSSRLISFTRCARFLDRCYLIVLYKSLVMSYIIYSKYILFYSSANSKRLCLLKFVHLLVLCMTVSLSLFVIGISCLILLLTFIL